MSSGLLRILATNDSFANRISLICVFIKKDLVLNNLKGLISYKTQPTSKYWWIPLKLQTPKLMSFKRKILIWKCGISSNSKKRAGIGWNYFRITEESLKQRFYDKRFKIYVSHGWLRHVTRIKIFNGKYLCRKIITYWFHFATNSWINIREICVFYI